MNMLEALSMGADLSNFRVMVVDDSRTWRMILTQELKALGMGNITQAKHGLEALELAQSTPLDLILLDIEMPEMDGLAVLENLKQSNLLQSLSVIVI